jgi:hypothetical protein
VIVSQNNKRSRRVSQAAIAIALSLIFALASSGYAFGDFVPVGTSTKVLGVGRIQSASHLVPVASEKKFVVSPEAVPADDASELAQPITRELAAVAALPEPEPVPVPEAAAQNNNSNASAEDASGWTSTMATNYGTASDGFLNQTTANGSLTTTTSMGVAHKSLPLGTQLELYCPATGLSCIVVVNDRGPYGGYWGAQPDSLDLQMGVSAALGHNHGWYEVKYRIL